MIVSVTEVQSFKRCRRQWDLGSFNRQALTPIIQPKPYLDLGTMVHKSLAYWTANPTDPITGAIQSLHNIFTAIAIQHKRDTITRYQDATGSEPTDEMLEPLYDAIVLGTAMMDNYQAYYGQPLPDRLKFCSPEQEIMIPIPNTEHLCLACCSELVPTTLRTAPCTECNGTGTASHYLKARLDALAIDEYDNVYVVERKTYSARPNLLLLEHTDQFIGYVWVAQQMNIGHVIGIAYDGLWKRAQPPQRPKRLELADLFCRTIITPSQDEVNEYGVELARTVQDMNANPYIYKNRVWQGCWDCSFEQLCAAQSQNDDIATIIQLQYTKRTEEDVSDIAQVVEA